MNQDKILMQFTLNNVIIYNVNIFIIYNVSVYTFVFDYFFLMNF